MPWEYAVPVFILQELYRRRRADVQLTGTKHPVKLRRDPFDKGVIRMITMIIKIVEYGEEICIRDSPYFEFPVFQITPLSLPMV